MLMILLTSNLLVSSPPSQFEALCTVLLWQPPMEPKGIITGYEIRYSSGHTVSLNSDNPYYKTTDREQVSELTVQVISWLLSNTLCLLNFLV